MGWDARTFKFSLLTIEGVIQDHDKVLNINPPEKDLMVWTIFLTDDSIISTSGVVTLIMTPIDKAKGSD